MLNGLGVRVCVCVCAMTPERTDEDVSGTKVLK